MHAKGGNVKLTTTIDVALGRGQNVREHHYTRAKRVKLEREATAKALKGPFPYGALHDDDGARITLHRPWARVALDSDNLSGAFKGVRDEVASFLGVDDKSERLHWIYTQSKQPKGTRPTVTIEVLPVADIDPQAKRVRELEAELHQRKLQCADLRRDMDRVGADVGASIERVRELEAMLMRWEDFYLHVLGRDADHDIVTSTKVLLEGGEM